MPLVFQCTSHGQVAFGFFNVDTDMLLLEHYFFFAPEFCNLVSDLANTVDPLQFRDNLPGYDIAKREKIGDLMGAIHGIRYTGFIGEIYRIFPFPKLPEAFRQKPEGYRNRKVVEEVIKKFAAKTTIAFVANNREGNVAFGEYEFSKGEFFELIKYVWEGGYPKWRDGHRPDYVTRMRQDVSNNTSGFFDGMIITA